VCSSTSLLTGSRGQGEEFHQGGVLPGLALVGLAQSTFSADLGVTATVGMRTPHFLGGSFWCFPSFAHDRSDVSHSPAISKRNEVKEKGPMVRYKKIRTAFLTCFLCVLPVPRCNSRSRRGTSSVLPSFVVFFAIAVATTLQIASTLVCACVLLETQFRWLNAIYEACYLRPQERYERALTS
jgi:hypothetical protein